MVVLCKQEGYMKINRSFEGVLEFQQNKPHNQQKIVMLMNTKVAAKSMEFTW